MKLAPYYKILIYIVFLLSSSHALALNGRVTLAWDPSPASNLGGYRVYIGETSRNYSRVIDIGNQTQFTVNDLEHGATFFFSVTAIDNTGAFESDFSNEVGKTIVYADVPLGHWAWEYIEAITDAGITLGCAPNLYCPTALLTRAQMALFLLRAKHGSGYIPPSAIGTVFYDVPLSHWAAAWIEDLAKEGITTGCGGGNIGITRNSATFL